jgi:RNA polymerase sigma factor (sigma-70 family)
LSDVALVTEMRNGDPIAWYEFDQRFRPGLMAFAARIRIPAWQRDECVTEAIEDTALKLAHSSDEIPRQLASYLAQAVRNRAYTKARSNARRIQHYERAASGGAADGVITSVCSAHAVRESAPAFDAEGVTTPRTPAMRLATALLAELTEDDHRIIGWIGEEVPYREIAAWLGISYDAASKRIWRLTRRLRAAALARAETMDDTDRAALVRMLSGGKK